jgi:hypothetical protein
MCCRCMFVMVVMATGARKILTGVRTRLLTSGTALGLFTAACKCCCL